VRIRHHVIACSPGKGAVVRTVVFRPRGRVTVRFAGNIPDRPVQKVRQLDGWSAADIVRWSKIRNSRDIRGMDHEPFLHRARDRCRSSLRASPRPSPGRVDARRHARHRLARSPPSLKRAARTPTPQLTRKFSLQVGHCVYAVATPWPGCGWRLWVR
jgi:hypothetical protein